MTAMEQRVNRGVRLLNEKMPNWFRKVLLTKLDILSNESCILGQLGHGNPFLILRQFGLTLPMHTVTPDNKKLEAHGFITTDKEHKEKKHPELTKMWKQKIHELRRKKA